MNLFTVCAEFLLKVKVQSTEISIYFMLFVVFVLQRQGSGAAAGNNKTSGGQGE